MSKVDVIQHRSWICSPDSGIMLDPFSSVEQVFQFVELAVRCISNHQVAPPVGRGVVWTSDVDSGRRIWFKI